MATEIYAKCYINGEYKYDIGHLATMTSSGDDCNNPVAIEWFTKNATLIE